MVNFSYSGLNKGKKVEGNIDAENNAKAVSKLKLQGILVSKIAINKNVPPAEDADPEPKFFMGMQLESDKLTTADILQFTNKLKTMIAANLPIFEAIKLLRRQSTKPGMIKVTKSLIEDLNQGNTFSSGLERFPEFFDDSYINMVKAGESSGTLGTFLEKINELITKKIKIVKDIKGAVTYPVILLTVAGLVTVVMLIMVVPTFQEIYKSMGVELPGSTQKVIAISEFLQSRGGILFFGGITVFIIGLKQGIKRSYAIRRRWHGIVLKLPKMGDLISKSIYAQLGMVLGNLLTAGVNVVEALDISSRVTTNIMMRESIDRIKKEILTGKSLSVLFKQERAMFPMEFSEFMRVGEKTGSVETMFFSISTFYSAEVEEAVEAMKQFIEPVMIVLIGIIICGLLMTLYQPIFSMGDAIK